MIIYKFPLAVVSHQVLFIPAGAEILSVGEQGGEVKLWAKLDVRSQTMRRKIIIRPTGHEFLEDNGLFIGTVQVRDFVWHVFDLGESPMNPIL